MKKHIDNLELIRKYLNNNNWKVKNWYYDNSINQYIFNVFYKGIKNIDENKIYRASAIISKTQLLVKLPVTEG